MEDQHREFEILSTEGELRGFIESSMYKDFSNELDIRIAALLEMLTDENLQGTGRFYDLTRGGIKNLRQMKDVFEDLLYGRVSQDEREISKE